MTDDGSLRMATCTGELQVRVCGEGPTAVLWSSMFVDSTTWDGMLDLLPGRRLVLVDPPGLGRSAPLVRRSSIAEAADAATDLLAGLARRGVIPSAQGVDWLGNAFGGHVGYQLAERPGALRSLVAVSAPLEPIAPELRARIGLLRPILSALGPVGPVRAAILDAMLTDASRADDRIRGVVEASLGRPTRRSMALALASFILDRTDVTALLPRMRVPSLFVASDDRGDWDPADAERAAAAAPQATAVTVRGARTLVPLERPTELAALVRDFWASVPEKSAAAAS